MIFLLILLLLFWGIVLFYKPQNISLKDRSTKPALERAREAKGTLVLGTILVLISMVTFDMSHLKLNPFWGALFGLSRPGMFEDKHYFQVITSNLIHFDIFHLGANITGILLLAAYERRVGAVRYLSVFAVSAIAASILELFVLGPDTLSLGASAGIAGLACGYFIDYKKLSLKEWSIGILFVLLIVFLLSINDKFRTADAEYGVNWISHLFGVLCAGIFFRLKPGKNKG